MTRFDIRFRREQIADGRIRSHMNYNSLMARHRRYHRRRIRGMVLLAFVLVLVLVLAMAWLETGFRKSETSDKPAIERVAPSDTQEE